MLISIRAVYENGRFTPLESLDLPEGQVVSLTIMSESALPGIQRSVRQILRLPAQERSRLLAEAAVKAKTLYDSDPDLADFEAFDEMDDDDDLP